MSIKHCANEIIEKYQSGLSCKKIADEYNVNKTTIYRFLKKQNISIRKYSDYKIYKMNENFLDILDTEEKNYILGLFYADGFNIKNKNEFGIALSGDDKYMVEKIQELLETDRPIRHYFPSINGQEVHELRLNSEHFSNRLTELGCVCNKSLIIKFPNFIHNNFMRDFIRGVFDGDGSIYNINKNGKRIVLLGTHDFCEGIQKVLLDFLDIKSFIYKNGNIYGVRFSKEKDVDKFFHWLYDDATIFLSRKYNKFEKDR